MSRADCAVLDIIVWLVHRRPSLYLPVGRVVSAQRAISVLREPIILLRVRLGRSPMLVDCRLHQNALPVRLARTVKYRD